MNKRYSRDKSFEIFKDVVVRHSLFRPPQSINVFDLSEVKLVTNHGLNNFYRLYDLYFFAYTPFVDLDLICKF